MRSNDGEGLFYFEVLYLLGLLADVSQDAAISVQDLAVDKVGSMGGQEHAGADHVLGGAPAACGGLGADEGIEGMAAAIGLDLAQGSGLSGGNVAGAHAVALDVVLAVLGGDVAGQHLQCALGGSVGGDSLAAQLTHHGADIDDLALALGNHIGQNSLGAVEGTANVHVDDAQEIGVAHLDHGHALH